MKSRILDQPDLQGPAGRAWLCEQKLSEAQQNKTAELEVWLVETSQDHPSGNHKVLALRHLRELDILEPVKEEHQNATHELWVMDINPENEDDINPHDLNTLHVMFPPVIEQFSASSDIAAVKLAEKVTELCVCGNFDPDCHSLTEWDNFIDSQVKVVA